MLSTKGPGLEARLSAYMDGEVSEAERREIEQLITRDDEARLVLEMLKAGNAFGNKAFEEFLHDPVPLALVRQIRQGTAMTPNAGRMAKPAPRKAKVRMWPRALAASFALLLIGGSTGYLLGKTSNDNIAPVELATARTWLDDIADYHRIYSRQQEHLVEVAASEPRAIESWLSASVGVTFKLPDLGAKGLIFQGGRLLVASGKPVAQLMYKNEDGDIFAICFLKSQTGDADNRMVESMRDDLAMISWKKSGAAYVVVGPSADADLQQMAETVFSQI